MPMIKRKARRSLPQKMGFINDKGAFLKEGFRKILIAGGEQASELVVRLLIQEGNKAVIIEQDAERYRNNC